MEKDLPLIVIQLILIDSNMVNLLVKVACKIQIWKKKHFVNIVTSLVKVLLKMTLFNLYLQKPDYFKLIQN